MHPVLLSYLPHAHSLIAQRHDSKPEVICHPNNLTSALSDPHPALCCTHRAADAHSPPPSPLPYESGPSLFQSRRSPGAAYQRAKNSPQVIPTDVRGQASLMQGLMRAGARAVTLLLLFLLFLV
jgi:hypothetical protein